MREDTDFIGPPLTHQRRQAAPMGRFGMFVLILIVLQSIGSIEILGQIRVPTIRAGPGIVGVEPVSGLSVEMLGDLDGDGQLEFALQQGRGLDFYSVDPRTHISKQNRRFVGAFDDVGTGVAVLNDLDGDGVAEIAAGGPSHSSSATGAIWIASGADRDVVLLDRDALHPADLQASAHFGQSICSIESLDDDSLMDLVVGAPGMDAVYLVYPDSAKRARSYDRFTFEGLTGDGLEFGYAVTSTGDLDLDGIPEIAVGAPNADGGGAVYIGFVQRGLPTNVRRWTRIDGSSPRLKMELDNADRFGSALSPGPDLDGDGIRELIVGAPGDDDGGPDRGAVWILFIKRDGTLRDAWKLSDTMGGVTGYLSDYYRFGQAVEWPGDLDNDGRDDLVITAPGAESFFFLYGLPAFPAPSQRNVRIEPPEPAQGEAVSVSGYWGDAVSEAILQFRRAGSQTYFEQAMLRESGSFEFSGQIPSAFVQTDGTEYALRIRLRDGTVFSSPTEGFYALRTRILGGLSLAVKGGQETPAYSLISIPLALDEPSAESILESSFGEADPAEWRFFGQEPSTGAVSELGSQVFDFVPGRGYWLVSANDKQLGTGSGALIPSAPPFRLPVRAGWNLVGNPYNFDFSSEGLRLDSGGPIDIRGYDGSWYVADSIRAMEGYALWSGSSDTLSFDTSARLMVEAVPEEAPASLWGIGVEARQGSNIDCCNEARVVNGAQSELDSFDRPEPPSLQGQLQAFFADLDWGSAANGSEIDARPSGMSEYVWTLTVGAPAGKPVSLRFNGIQTVPKEFVAFVQDEEGNTLLDLRQSDQLDVTPKASGEARRMRLVVTTNTNGFESAPAARLQLEAFPNPFRKRTSIRFRLPESSPVDVSVYDMLGRRVRQVLGGGVLSAGYHLFSWDGFTASGMQAAPGLYLIRLETPSRRISVRTNFLP